MILRENQIKSVFTDATTDRIILQNGTEFPFILKANAVRYFPHGMPRKNSN